MKILIELPTWLGDSVMTSPAIENIVRNFKDVHITLIGSSVSIEVLKNHPNVFCVYEIDKNYLRLFKCIKDLGSFDIFLSFRSSLRSKFIKFCVKSKRKYQFDKNKFKEGHQVQKYNNFINLSMNTNSKPGRLKLQSFKKIKDTDKKLLGINPGATYGSAKRWYPEKFAAVASDLSSLFDIIILGSENEKEIASDIESYLIKKGVTNYKNLSGKTSINELIYKIKNLDLFITGDSGPMHLAAAYEIPTVAIFGPTNEIETSQWMNKKSIIIKKNIDCRPCMQRTCPLKHHKCMKLIDPSEVLRAAIKLNQTLNS